MRNYRTYTKIHCRGRARGGTAVIIKESISTINSKNTSKITYKQQALALTMEITISSLPQYTALRKKELMK
jgi:hypothetical protein